MATLYGNASSFRTQKVLVAAKKAGKKVDVKDNVPQDKFPLALAPAFIDGETHLFGTDAIVAHLTASDKTYFPQTNPALYQWLQWAEGELLPNVLAYVLPSVSVAQVDHDTHEHAKKELLAQLQHFDKVLSTKTFLVGERLSAADVSVAFNLLPAFQHVLDDKARKQLVNVTRYFNTIVNQKIVKEVVGDVKLATEVATFNADQYKKNAASTKKEDKKQDKKQEKKPEKPKAKAPEAEEEPEAPVEKFVDPFLKFPAGTFNYDNFKRVYSNEDVDKSIPYFWENFDAENNSIWYAEYKYPEDLTLTFMSCNLISGMFQRLDKMRKYAFGSVCLFGSDNASTISGIWFWRGPELAFELSPDWQVDYESYSWKKLDPKDDATKKLVQEYFSWEGDFGGKKFNQGKIFK